MAAQAARARLATARAPLIIIAERMGMGLPCGSTVVLPCAVVGRGRGMAPFSIGRGAAEGLSGISCGTAVIR
jgi:hypothetical protein